MIQCIDLSRTFVLINIFQVQKVLLVLNYNWQTSYMMNLFQLKIIQKEIIKEFSKYYFLPFAFL
jgi:hypothetical protein